MNGNALKITISCARRGIGICLPRQSYVRRSSPLGNPQAIGREGSREQVISKQRRLLWAQLQTPNTTQERELRRLLAQARSGELELICWCAPLPCHEEVVRSTLLWLARVEGLVGAERQQALLLSPWEQVVKRGKTCRADEHDLHQPQQRGQRLG